MRMLITGAASGIGRAATLMAAEALPECSLVLVDSQEPALAAVADEARAAGATVWCAAADLSDPTACARAVDVAETRLGGLDALVSNAGYARSASLRELETDEFDRSFAVNTRAVWLLGKAAFPMLAESRGAIVATASMSARHPTPPLGAYSASKAALVMLVQQLALEWGPYGIRCNVVSPGPTATGMTAGSFADAQDETQRRNRTQREAHIPLRRVGEAADVAGAILFLAGSSARQITGIDLTVDGGLSIGLMPAVGGGQGHGPSA
jgi:NAD(P)-dependent dehydrogenase (short-subunit alcohol dehydrogenase family)